MSILGLRRLVNLRGACFPPSWPSTKHSAPGVRSRRSLHGLPRSGSSSAPSALRVQLLEAERDVEKAQKNKERIAEELRSAGAIRALLYEKGKPLEHAIIEALRLLGFTAASFKESDSEFDVVFESGEGRLIGEAEGKDNKAVNIDKLRQLRGRVQCCS